jgi:hypothetical protein
LDWEYVLRLASSNKVFPLLYKNIKLHCSESIPACTLKQLKKICIKNSARNLSHLVTLFCVVELFKKNDVEILVFKGPVLAESVFGDINLRSFGDLDILLPRKDLRKAILLLINEGFSTDIDLSLAQYEKLVAKGHHAVLVRGNAIVELHWELSGRYFTKAVDFEAVAGRTTISYVKQVPVISLGAEDLLVYLCIHGCRHAWVQLDMVCCVNELVYHTPQLDWELTFKLAKDQGAMNMLTLDLLLASRILDLKLPSPILLDVQKTVL